MADDSERDDPVLVRPYITTQPLEPDERPAPTWPATADLPEDGTRELPGVVAPVSATVPDPAAKTTALRRQKLLVLAGTGVLALLGGAGLFLLQPSGDENPPATARPAPSAPGVTRPAGAAPVASAGTITASAGSSIVSRPATTTRPTATPGTEGAAVGGAAGPGPARTTTPAPGAPSPTLSPPPGTARTGAITAAGGRCLFLGGILGLDGAPVQTSGCADVSYQRWTLATDGTLMVANRCAAVSGDGSVRIGDCDDRPAAQWRAGPGGSLVNPQTGRCLTDPGALATPVTVTDCTGAATQTWTLP
ncbi:RICIN domain-containing protein [Actinoplanes auranticolor]|uniref:Ricin B lectin domain-containing protein n=1 Tax=Actinoplanes auranticolor TaxID=47988 RepID=A0A919VSQ1_9ACTN|nr:RICIN domain-containing protein [Actinoplanes auranticolor]GIM68069.1 hypothetical protein Aau02nite_29980 [Actinoplanes auranticolor]